MLTPCLPKWHLQSRRGSGLTLNSTYVQLGAKAASRHPAKKRECQRAPTIPCSGSLWEKMGSARESKHVLHASTAQFPAGIPPDIPSGTSPSPPIPAFPWNPEPPGSTNGCALLPPGPTWILFLKNFLGNERRGKTWELSGIFSEGKPEDPRGFPENSLEFPRPCPLHGLS